MDKSSDGLRQINLDEKIEADDIFFVDGKASLVLAWMVGKTIYEASLQYFAGGENILTIFRQEQIIKCLDSDKRVRVHVAYSYA